MSFEDQVSQNKAEAEVESIKDLGSVPMNLFNQIEPTAAAMDEAPRQIKSKFFRGLLVLSIFLGACAAPREMTMPGPLGDEFALYDKGIPPVGEASAQEAVNQPAEAEQVADSDGLRPYLVEASTSWRFGGQVIEGDAGIWAALVRMAREKGLEFQWLNQVPEGMTEAVEIWRHGRMVALHSVSNVLETNPTIYPGDTITHTFVTDESLTNMQRDNGLRAEDIHL